MSCCELPKREEQRTRADVEAIIDEHKPYIIPGNESWLNSDILSSEIFPDKYTVGVAWLEE